MTMRPLSARNPRITRLGRLVRRREERVEQRALVVEGPVLLGAALDAGAVVREVYVDAGAADAPGVRSVLDRLPVEVEPWVLPAGALDRIGDVATSRGVLAVVEAEPAPWPSPSVHPFVLVLAGIQIPGNVGTLVRAAVAAGAGAVVCVGGADPSSPKVVRAAAGCTFAVDLVTDPTLAPALERLRGAGYRIAAATVHEGEPYAEADLRGPIALVLGSEAHGVDASALASDDLRVTIPMAGPAESLTVAMAGTLLCFEVLRRGGTMPST